MSARGVLRAAVSLALGGALAGCGDAKPVPVGDLRVVLATSSADGAPPADGFSLVGQDGVRVHLIRKPGPVAEYVARGGDGLWSLETPPDFGVVGEAEHAYRRGLEPMTVFVGRKRTLYLVPRDGWRVLDALVLPERTATVAESELPSKRETGADGRLALRMDEEAWGKGPVIVTALVEAKEGGPGGRFSTQVRAVLPSRGAPAAVVVEPASVVPLALRMAYAPGGAPAAGATVQATVWFGRLLAKQTAVAGKDGVARLDQLPAASRGVTTRVTVDGALYDVTSARDAEEALLVVAGPGALEAQGSYDLTDGTGTAEVLGLAPGIGYGRIPWVEKPEGAGVQVRFRSPGVSRYFVRRGEKGAFDGEGGPGARPPQGPLALVALCRVQVTLAGVSSSRPFDLVARRREGSAWVSGDGWTLRRRMRPECELYLPAGDWRLEARDADGRAGPVVEQKLSAPGTQAVVEVKGP